MRSFSAFLSVITFAGDEMIRFPHALQRPKPAALAHQVVSAFRRDCFSMSWLQKGIEYFAPIMQRVSLPKSRRIFHQSSVILYRAGASTPIAASRDDALRGRDIGHMLFIGMRELSPCKLTSEPSGYLLVITHVFISSRPCTKHAIFLYFTLLSQNAYTTHYQKLVTSEASPRCCADYINFISEHRSYHETSQKHEL